MDMDEETRKKLEEIAYILDQIIDDTSIPRNIRKGAKESKERLFDESQPLDLRSAGVISTLDELANDPNIPLHGRTLIYQVISRLETLT